MKLIVHMLIFGLFPFFGNAQVLERSELGPAGQSESTTNYMISHTLGGLTVSTETGSSIVITQDFEQPESTDRESEFDIPNTFTPDNDGVNDTWVVNFPETITDVKITVLNRWGDHLCEVDHYSTGSDIWNGKQNNSGDDSAAGTYFYIIESESAGVNFSGWLQLIR